MHEDRTPRGMASTVKLHQIINRIYNCITMLQIPKKLVTLSLVAVKFEDTDHSCGADKMA